MKGKFLKTVYNKLEKKNTCSSNSDRCEQCCQFGLWCFTNQHDDAEEEESIPRDVPKGHLVVYVGQYHRRFVIKITLLKHPLFKALLDQAREEYDFTTHSKLCIPCDENMFLTVLRCAASRDPKKLCFCI